MDWKGIHRYWPAALAAIFGIIASLSFFDHARKAAQDRMSVEFSVQVETRARDLQEVLSRYEGTIEGFAAAFPYQGLDQDRFRAYAKNVFLASSMLKSGFESLSWAPRVDDRARGAFEAAASAEKHAEYAIREKTSENGLIVAPQNPTYYPLRYVEPERSNSPLGLDLPRDAALQKAIATGATTASPPTRSRSAS
jgi:CHASE1-domain containing sensor protein